MKTSTLTSVRAGRRLFREEDGAGHEQKLGYQQNKQKHKSVLLKEAVELLILKKEDKVIDATAGEGGHSEYILSSAPVSLIALDADSEAVLKTKERLIPFGTRARVIEANFADLTTVLSALRILSVDKILFDLGWNRGQLLSGRGFSFSHDEPLNMSYGSIPASGFTAADILNTWSEKTLADIIFGYGEERYARRIAHSVVAFRRIHPLTSTSQLVNIISQSVPDTYRHGRIHPATKTFQALRIAVNDELRVLDKGLRSAWRVLSPHGRMVVITFHSIEDRVVKKLFQEFTHDGGELLTKKPLVVGRIELLTNLSSRSAKLRGIEKI